MNVPEQTTASSVASTVDADGIAVLTWDLPGSPVNKISEQSLADFEAAVQAALADTKVIGIVIASAKADFIVGADLAMVQAMPARSAADCMELIMRLHRLLRAMEKGGKPVAAALSGSALGGGLEIALGCHFRVCADKPKLKLGLVEVKVGLMPGGGGTQRLPRLVKLQESLQLLTEGKQVGAQEALTLGIVHKVVPPDAVLAEAKGYIKGGGTAVQPWDQPGFRLPSGEVHSAKGFETFTGANGLASKATNGNYPAIPAILRAVYHGLQLEIDEGCTIEAREFVNIARSQTAQNMIRTLFFSINAANKLYRRPLGVPKRKVERVGILGGGGFMGSGIADVSALNGMEVILVDETLEKAERGKKFCADELQKRVSKGHLTAEAAAAILSRIRPTANYADLSGCSLVIECVFESRQVKHTVLPRAEAALAEDGILASNTSTLPIGSLCEGLQRLANVIGIHFFAPVVKMPLVEIIRAASTSNEAVALACDYVQQIGKTPIVVNDGHGFYTSRVFSTYCAEGVNMLEEGVPPALIDNAGRLAGMPMGPLEVLDMVGLDTVYKISDQGRQDLGEAFHDHRLLEALHEMVVVQNRLGQKNGKGFYDYSGKDKRLWSGLSALASAKARSPRVEELKNRLLIIQAVETIRCLEEGIVRSPADADVGSVLGWGFCPFFGGVVSYIDTFGTREFLKQVRKLSWKYGSRFAPPALLVELARQGKKFYGHDWE